MTVIISGPSIPPIPAHIPTNLHHLYRAAGPHGKLILAIITLAHRQGRR